MIGGFLVHKWAQNPSFLYNSPIGHLIIRSFADDLWVCKFGRQNPAVSLHDLPHSARRHAELGGYVVDVDAFVSIPNDGLHLIVSGVFRVLTGGLDGFVLCQHEDLSHPFALRDWLLGGGETLERHAVCGQRFGLFLVLVCLAHLAGLGGPQAAFVS